MSPAAAGPDLPSGAGIDDHLAAYAVQLARPPAKVWDALPHQEQGDPAHNPVDAATRTIWLPRMLRNVAAARRG